MAADISFLLSLVLLFLKRPRATQGRDMRHVVLTGWRLCSVSIHLIRCSIDRHMSVHCVTAFSQKLY